MKLFVWDFHGVLEKGNEGAVLEISNKILGDFGYKERFGGTHNERLYGKKWFQYFEDLLPSESVERHLELQFACMDYEINHPTIIEDYIKPNEYAEVVLSQIAKKHGQIVISNMADIALERFMKAVGVIKFFPEGYAFANNSHKVQVNRTKGDVLRSFLDGKSFDDIVVIGDRPEDVAMKNVAGGVSYLFAHPGRDFHQAEADFRIRDLREVLREV